MKDVERLKGKYSFPFHLHNKHLIKKLMFREINKGSEYEVKNKILKELEVKDYIISDIYYSVFITRMDKNYVSRAYAYLMLYCNGSDGDMIKDVINNINSGIIISNLILNPKTHKNVITIINRILDYHGLRKGNKLINFAELRRFMKEWYLVKDKKWRVIKWIIIGLFMKNLLSGNKCKFYIPRKKSIYKNIKYSLTPNNLLFKLFKWKYSNRDDLVIGKSIGVWETEFEFNTTKMKELIEDDEIKNLKYIYNKKYWNYFIALLYCIFSLIRYYYYKSELGLLFGKAIKILLTEVDGFDVGYYLSLNKYMMKDELSKKCSVMIMKICENDKFREEVNNMPLPSGNKKTVYYVLKNTVKSSFIIFVRDTLIDIHNKLLT